MSRTIAFVNGIVVCMDENRTVLNPGHVVIEGDRIVKVTQRIEDVDSHQPAEVIDVKGKIVFPGLINTHMHMRPSRGFGDGLNTPDWHVNYVDRISELMTESDAYDGALLAFTELVRSGTTCALGMTIHGDPEFEAIRKSGVRARLVPHAESEEALRQHMRLIRSQSGGEEDLVRHWLGFEVTSIFETALLREVRECADETGVPIHTHFSEWDREAMEPLVESGLLGPDLILAHCVHVNDEEIGLLAKHQVKVAHNPKSNMRLGSGIAPIMEMLRQGVNISLGTDGPLSTYKLDMWEEIRSAALLQRVLNAKNLQAWEVLEMATINGARALGMEASIGSIEEGKKADLIVLDINKPHLTPLQIEGPNSNLAPLLVFSVSGSDVESTMVDGKFLMKNREIHFVDEDQLIERVNRISERIISNL